MKKGYQKILTLFEKWFPTEVTLNGIKKELPETTEQDLLTLQLAGFLEVNLHSSDKFGDHHYILSKDGFNHLWGLRAYHMAKRTKVLTYWIMILTIIMIALGIIQIIKLA